MNPRQLQRFLDEAGMSQRGAARELDISERTMRRYIAGELPVPRVVEFALRWLASQRRSK
jgi:DNA transposition AAA+ family ATPase